MIIEESEAVRTGRAALEHSKMVVHSQYLSSGMTETHTQEEWEEYLHNKDFSVLNKILSTSEGRSKFSKAMIREWALRKGLPYPSDWDAFIAAGEK